MKAWDYTKEIIKMWNVEVSDELLSVYFSKNGINEESSYHDNEKNVAKVFHSIIPLLLSFKPKSISEGGYSITYDKDAIIAYYNEVCLDFKFKNALEKGVIKDISGQW